MSTYIHFTKEQREQARQTDLASFLVSQGEKIKRSGSEYEWLDGTQKVTIRGNLWFHQYEQKGGDAIDFIRKFYNKNYAESVEFLLGNSCGCLIYSSPVVKEKKPFELPKANDNMRRMLAYLLVTRGIDKDVLYEFIRHKMIYESEKYHNAVFVGYDNKGKARHAHKRGTVTLNPYKGNVSSSVPEFSFYWNGTSNKIYLFEAPIDMLSFISLHKENWRAHTYAASCSVSDRVLFQCLNDNPNLSKVYLCRDNDDAGQKANSRIAEKLNQMNIQNEVLVPTHKDWNEDLLQSEESEVKCQQVLSP